MAKTTRNEAWHEAYKAIFSKTGCLRLTVDQVSGYMGVPKRDVCRRYPEAGTTTGPVMAVASASGSIHCWIRNLERTREVYHERSHA